CHIRDNLEVLVERHQARPEARRATRVQVCIEVVAGGVIGEAVVPEDLLVVGGAGVFRFFGFFLFGSFSRCRLCLCRLFSGFFFVVLWCFGRLFVVRRFGGFFFFLRSLRRISSRCRCCS